MMKTENILWHAIFFVSRSSHRCSIKKGVLRNFTKFKGKRQCQSLFLIKLPEACNFIKKETLAQVFSCEFYEIFYRTPPDDCFCITQCYLDQENLLYQDTDLKMNTKIYQQKYFVFYDMDLDMRTNIYL